MLQTVRTFDQQAQAHFALSLLANEGIKGFVNDEHLANVHGLMSNALGGIKLQVLPGDVEAARTILQQRFDQGVNADGLSLAIDESFDVGEVEEDTAGTVPTPVLERCPACDHTEWTVYYPYVWILFVLPILFPIALIKKRRCNACHTRW